ncbi:bacteriohemerythrin [Telmatospirillum sp.]|uniref:bacteriohemerythrin n=1 Tax=Telmatospirillum sp. TaxID=2079197 RepID=UPI0028438E24|nr:bacteriohemerythrin [Telmatospirillum sp.]MDR3441128.1 bacteriohemerythrin [Telmatospirillum sp.]
MSLVQWSEDLTVGVASVDADHRKLFSLVNYLYDSMVAGKDAPVVDEFIDSLLVYTRQHFEREEAFFEETGYPDRLAHQKEHETLIVQITDVRNSFKSGATPKKTLEMIGFLNKWLIEHVRKSDMKYAPHLNAKGIS